MSTFNKKKKAQKKIVTEQAHCLKPNINPKQQMENQTQSKEKNNIWQTQQMVQPHGFSKKKKKKNLKPNIQSADSSSKAKTEIKKGET